jgi:hypothetical protein
LIKDQKPPACKLPAYIRPCQVDCAVPEICILSFAKERTGLWERGKDAPVIKKDAMLLCYYDLVPHPGILVPDKEGITGQLLFYGPHKTKVTTTLTALGTFKSQE